MLSPFEPYSIRLTHERGHSDHPISAYTNALSGQYPDLAARAEVVGKGRVLTSNVFAKLGLQLSGICRERCEAADFTRQRILFVVSFCLAGANDLAPTPVNIEAVPLRSDYLLICPPLDPNERSTLPNVCVSDYGELIPRGYFTLSKL